MQTRSKTARFARESARSPTSLAGDVVARLFFSDMRVSMEALAQENEKLSQRVLNTTENNRALTSAYDHAAAEIQELRSETDFLDSVLYAILSAHPDIRRTYENVIAYVAVPLPTEAIPDPERAVVLRLWRPRTA